MRASPILTLPFRQCFPYTCGISPIPAVFPLYRRYFPFTGGNFPYSGGVPPFLAVFIILFWRCFPTVGNVIPKVSDVIIPKVNDVIIPKVNDVIILKSQRCHHPQKSTMSSSPKVNDVIIPKSQRCHHPQKSTMSSSQKTAMSSPKSAISSPKSAMSSPKSAMPSSKSAMPSSKSAMSSSKSAMSSLMLLYSYSRQSYFLCLRCYSQFCYIIFNPSDDIFLTLKVLPSSFGVPNIDDLFYLLIVLSVLKCFASQEKSPMRNSALGHKVHRQLILNPTGTMSESLFHDIFLFFCLLCLRPRKIHIALHRVFREILLKIAVHTFGDKYFPFGAKGRTEAAFCSTN